MIGLGSESYQFKLRGNNKVQQEVLLTVPQAAEQLTVTVATIRAWVLRRKIGFHKIGGRVRIPAKEVKRILEDSFVPPRAA